MIAKPTVDIFIADIPLLTNLKREIKPAIERIENEKGHIVEFIESTDTSLDLNDFIKTEIRDLDEL